ncbi:MAG: hypothetical protein IPI28_04240 [Candidatus Omnitrophica bacterium]|nr:hypothetical protein [Candidatus Omnitrophota bacterium]
MRVEHPGIHVLGPFDGSLSGGGELVTLEDASGNPADEVLYSDEGRWPSYPDGGGHSLELRDPHSDNSQPETWSFSREDDAASWKTYSYRGIAKDQPGTNFPVQWNEFILGLLTMARFSWMTSVSLKIPRGLAGSSSRMELFLPVQARGESSETIRGL